MINSIINKKGFTLTEISVVMLIISFLIIFGGVKYNVKINEGSDIINTTDINLVNMLVEDNIYDLTIKNVLEEKILKSSYEILNDDNIKIYNKDGLIKNNQEIINFINNSQNIYEVDKEFLLNVARDNERFFQEVDIIDIDNNKTEIGETYKVIIEK